MYQCRVLCVVLVAAVVTAEITDSEYYQLPRLFHLDEYSRCEARGGLYCLATFHLSAPPPPASNHTYSLIQEYSSNIQHFDRRWLYRGWCVSSRCGSGTTRNDTRRLELCGEEWGRKNSLSVRLHTVHYCHNHDNPKTSDEKDTLSEVFGYIIRGIILLNVIGTAYDVATGDEKKNNILASWSIPSNWKRLMNTEVGSATKDLALQPVNGFRYIFMASMIFAHSVLVHFEMYLNDSRLSEELLEHPLIYYLKNGTTVVQVFVALSSFLLAYSLIPSKSHSYALVLKIILHRMIRMSPVQLLSIAYAATWLKSAGSGPQWEVVRAESDLCRQKLWTHLLQVSNFVQPERHCGLTSWFTAVDMQLCIVASFVTLFLVRRRRRALPVLAVLIVATSFLNSAIAYLYNYKPMVYNAQPEAIRVAFSNVRDFTEFYVKPWASLPASLIGIFAAFLTHDLHARGFNVSDHTCLVWLYNMAVPVCVSWMMAGKWLVQHTARPLTVALVGFERTFVASLSALSFIIMANGFHNALTRVLRWRVWQVLARMSLAYMVFHYFINLAIVANKPQPLHTTFFDITSEWVMTMLVTSAVALPVTLLLEMPAQRSLTALLA